MDVRYFKISAPLFADCRSLMPLPSEPLEMHLQVCVCMCVCARVYACITPCVKEVHTIICAAC